MFSTSDEAARPSWTLRRVARSVLYAAGLMALLLLAGCADQIEGEVQVLPDGSWTGQIHLTLQEPVAEAGWEQAMDARLREQAAEVLAGRQVEYDLTRTAAQDGSVVYTVAAQGGDLESLAAILSDRRVVAAGLGGPALLKLSGSVQKGERLAVALPANAATGYSWAVAPQAADGRPGAERLAELDGEPITAGQNGLERQVFHLAAEESGVAGVRLEYQRPWAPGATPTRLLSLRAVDRDLAPVLAALGPGRAVSTVETHVVPAQGTEPDAGEEMSNPLSNKNWCAEGGCTPIRDQGACGSCWAFATVGPLESAIKRYIGLSVDLSEQYLVSCNNNGWGCAGGWWAHDYHQQRFVLPQTRPGAVLEASFPYRALDVACGRPYAHPYRIGGWSYVNPSSPYTVPSTDAIKDAISTHGPLTAGVCVGSAFQRYSGGIFVTDESGVCGSSVNHGIVLVGWNDADETWILRNSWGTNWGEGGYMRIRWGTSRVGYAASYVLAEPPQDDHIPRAYMPMTRKR